jgi:hypothetical protein
MIVACFDVNTTVMVLEEGRRLQKLVGDVRVGELVQTVSDDGQREMWTEVVGVEASNVSSLKGSFLFTELEVEDGSKVTVTSDHGVLVREWESGSRAALRVLASKDIVEGEELVGWKSGEWRALKVKKSTLLKKSSKITLRTRSGTVLANGVLVSTLCGEAYDSGSGWSETVKGWKEVHFGLEEREGVNE